LTQQAIADVIGVSREAIKKWNTEDGWDAISSGTSTKAYTPTPAKVNDKRVKLSLDDKKQIAAEVKKGKAQAQVAADHGISQPRVSQITKADATDRKKRSTRKKAEQKRTKAQEDTGLRAVDTLQALIDAGLTFGCIYADPPWQYGNQGTRASTDNHYETMSVEAICAEPVAQVAADGCHLHLWTTNAFLFDAKAVMEAWGFEYKSCFIWVKPQMGLGNYWRVSHEFLLLGVKGETAFKSKSQRSWLEEKRRTHSEKPPSVRDLLEKVSPGPFLEMYARKAAKGWIVYGNEVA
jgi:N6-adenosine-specific RNA methylase IME4